MEAKKETQTLMDFCLRGTQVGELVVVRDAGYAVATAYIDAEDLFPLPPSLSMRPVASDEWGAIRITTEHGDRVYAPCHYVDIA